MKWTEDELRLALALYCQLPFGKMHSRNPEIVRLAKAIGRTPSAVSMKLVNFASLDPEIIKSGRVGLGNASSMDRLVWNKFQENWDAELSKATEDLGLTPEMEPEDTDEAHVIAEDTARMAEVQVRRKQYLFRRIVLSSYVFSCCISGLTEPRLLVASHIIPWNKNNENRLNPRNGLCLSALHDKAFDIGLLTVMPDYKVAVSAQISRLHSDRFAQETLVACHGKRIVLPEKFLPAPEFLEWHNRNVFLH